MSHNSLRGVGALGLFFAVYLVCPGGEVALKSRDVSLAVVDGTARGLALAGITKIQHEKALANWRLQFAKETPPFAESNRFLLYGSVTGKNLKDIGAALDKQYALALKALATEHEDPWPGKMAIYFYEQRLYFAGFCRTVEKRKLEEDESGTFDIDSDFPHAAAMPPLAKGELPAELQAGAQMAAAAMHKKAGSKAPAWLLQAFGRAVVLKTSSPTGLAADRRKAYALVFKQKRTLKDVLGTSLPDEEGLVLRGSFVDYLALSGKLARFPQFCKGFEPSDTVPEPTVTMALEKADYTTDKLDAAWQNWVRTVK